MDLKKCVIRGKYQSTFYCKRSEVVQEKNAVVLGFKDNLAVLGNPMAEDKSGVGLNVKKTLKVEVNSQTGEKFINLNGKKLKIMTESVLPPQLRQNTHMMKVVSTEGLVTRKPVTIKLLGTMSSLLRSNLIKKQESQDKNIFNSNVNKADSGISADSELSQKTMLIKENKLPTLKNPSVGKVFAARAGTLVGCVNGLEQNAKYTNTTLELNHFKDKTYKSVSDMKSSDLAKLKKENSAAALTKKADKSVQTDKSDFESDKCVQTTEPFQDIASMLDSFDLCEFVNNDLTSPTTIPIKNMNMADGLQVAPLKNMTTVKDEKLMMFFNDLRSALQPDTRGNMPIHVGVLSNNVNYVKRICNVLKALQKSVDLLNHSDLTALQLAVFNDSDPEIVKILLRNNASLEATDTDGNNILHLAVEFERKEILDIILRAADERRFSLDQFNAEGMTALMICCCNRLHACADLLLKYDADVNVRDRKSGRTALFHAAENCDYEMVKILLNNQADTKIKNFFGTSPHDAMYEVDEIPENIKMAILGRNTKRKIVDEPKAGKVKKTENKKPLKTYARLRKINEFDFMSNITTGQVKQY